MNNQTIALYNHFSGTGHHESWTAIFALQLLKHNYNVICLTPDVESLKVIIKSHKSIDQNRLYLVKAPELPELELQNKIYASWLEKLITCLYRYGEQTIETQITNDMPVSKKIKKFLLHFFLPPFWKILKKQFGTKRLLMYAGLFHIGNKLPPRDLNSIIETATSGLSLKADFLLFMYLDTIVTHPKIWKGLTEKISLPWSGIRFMPFELYGAGIEGYCSIDSFKGMCLLNEKNVREYSICIPGKIFKFIPDVTYTEISSKPVKLINTISEHAAGRKIVLLCGSIESRKNIEAFCRIALKANPDKWFFCLIGQFHSSTFSKKEKNALINFKSSRFNNTFLHDYFFKDEREINAIIKVSDVIFAVYRDFKISSNILSKAAYFKKPILVSNRFLMGELVRKYKIGLSLPENDINTMLEGLEQLSIESIPEENYATYRNDFNITVLGNNLNRFIADCLLVK